MNLVGDCCPLRRLVRWLATIVTKTRVGFLVLLLWYRRSLAGLALAAAMVKAGAPWNVVFMVAAEVCVLTRLKTLGKGLLT
jgi:predicted naringenin-chalcone synthase